MRARNWNQQGRHKVDRCDAPQSNVRHIGTDNTRPGGRRARRSRRRCRTAGSRCLSAMDADNARERVQGIKESIAGTKVELVDVFTDQVDSAKAKANMENVLVKYPDIALLSGLWSYETPLIYDAVKAAGKAGKVKIVGFDEDQRTLRGSTARSNPRSCSSRTSSATSPPPTSSRR
jgi:ribose transport system substrate-binding protein